MNGGPINRRGLTIKQSLFVKHYVQTGGNGFQSAIAAGYNSSPEVLRSIASENLTKPNIQRELQRTMKKALSKEEVLSELTEVAQKSPVIKGSDKMKALELIGRFHKMFTDKVETSSPQDEVKHQIIQEVAQRFGLSEDRARVMVTEVYGDSDLVPPVEELASEAIS